MTERTATRTSSRTKSSASAAPAATTTRTTRARAAAANQPSKAPAPAAKKAVSRKPLAQRNTSPEEKSPSSKSALKGSAIPRKATKALAAQENEREPIMAYLRIRPQINEEEEASSPYLTQLSDTTVRMTDPQDHQTNPSRFRPSTVPPSSTYKFSHVFPLATTQSEFFEKTTLPLVRDALNGQNGLLFTYGVTNSGKTYTVQGGSTEDSAGILPRAFDVIFNSIDGLQGDSKYRPVRLLGVELADPADSRPPPSTPEPAVAQVLGSQMSSSNSAVDMNADSTVLKLDRNYEYSIWLSYAEVYNEKVYDLLETVKNGPQDNPIPRSGSAPSLVFTRTALPLKPSPSTDSPDSDIKGRYISGLRQFRVNSASEARALVKLGQIHRRVFGTLANRESSRSHGMVIIKIMRCHRGEKNDPTAIQISRLTLVDLAGSERTKHTQTTGDRLKEAGNINNSLMVLGQCLEALRSNQHKVAVSLSQEGKGEAGRMDTREVKKSLAIIPFRHSKLTEALMDYFVGDGRSVMIVNVNPYDTGYDENSHVMKFSALAREVYITPAPAPLQKVPTVGPGKLQGKVIKQLGPMTLRDPAIIPRPPRRKVTISTGGPGSGKKLTEQILEVEEIDQPDNGNDEGEDDDVTPINPLVDALFDEIESLRMQLFESEMRCADIEAETREEVMREMEERMQEMERMYTRRLMKEVEANEVKTDAKIDMLHQSGLFGSPVKRPQQQHWSSDEEEEEEDVEMSLTQEDDEDDDEDDDEESSSGEEFDFDEDKLMSKPVRKPSLAPREVREKREFIPDPSMLPSDNEEAETTEGETETEADGSVAPSDDETADLDSQYESEDDDSNDDEWVPSAPTPRAKPVPRTSNASLTRSPKGKQPQQARFLTSKARLSTIEKGINALKLAEEAEDVVGEDSMIIVPKSGSTAKKKTRKLSTAPVYRVEDIEEEAQAADIRSGGKNIRRFVN
ncbi:kinesin-like protein kif23 [Moniliophthora roreri MCA 2997]|uniref:Kinesin-like protein n=1 Tax=Moniliophthora roreri (strain MCA 2997) TaxID=1381753 RepID=V2XP60_MONRO|nr:kinesin-like protein kif23 [Moniliophthora roreri MCA 2997]